MTDKLVEGVTKLNDLREGLRFTLEWEGGYSNDFKDPGGETKWGISKRAYPNEDIKNLTRERALEIYAKDYWLASGCDALPFPYNVCVFDTAVNCGVSRAKDWLRKAKDVDDFMSIRRDHYVNIINKNPTLARFAKGWWARMTDMKKYLEINKDKDSPKVI